MAKHKMMRILLTGGNGMIGRNLLEHPDIDEFEILAPSSTELNLCNYEATINYMERNRPDFVIHAAGKVGGIQANLREPTAFLLENLDMGRNVIWASRQTGIKCLLNLGSSCMYPRGHNKPLREELVLKGELEPSNEGYALAKIITARLCEYIMREDVRFQYKTLIPCNIYGWYDKFDQEHSHLVPAIIHKLHYAKKYGFASVEVWGDGSARREFMYAGDLADAVVKALKSFDSLPSLMNLGLGFDYSVDEYYELAALAVGYSGAFTHDHSKPTGMMRKLVNVDRQRNWGWSPKTGLAAGLEKTYAYYLKACLL
jgi:GDP-L-fucose synthase